MCLFNGDCYMVNAKSALLHDPGLLPLNFFGGSIDAIFDLNAYCYLF